MAPVRIGCQARSWSHQFVIRDQLDEVARLSREIGFVGLEIGAAFLDLEQPALVRDTLARHGLVYAGIHLGGTFYDPGIAREKSLPALRRGAAFGFAAGARSAIISSAGKRIAGSDQHTPLTPEEHRQNVAGLRAACQIATDLGLTVHYHNHGYEIAHGGEVLDRLLEGIDPSLMSLAFDLGHARALYPGEQVPDLVRRYGERLGYLHYRDFTGATACEALGDGEIDFAAVAQALQDIRFAGWAVLEIEPDPRQGLQRTVAEDIRISYEVMRKTLQH